MRIEKEQLLKLLMERVEYWTSEESYIELFSKYYSDLVEYSFWDEIDCTIEEIVDNDYINNTLILEKDELPKYSIFDDNDERILAITDDGKFYLCSAF